MDADGRRLRHTENGRSPIGVDRRQSADDSDVGSEDALRPRLLRGRDREHEQSYFLFGVAPDDLAFARMPLGEWTKEETRRRLREAGHPASDEPSSQDLCFAPGGAVASLVTERVPEVARPGPIVDLEGRALGSHRGLARYTVGQRRGIGLAAGEPLYVVELRPGTNELVVGPREALTCSAFEVEEAVWLGKTDMYPPMDADGRRLNHVKKGRRIGVNRRESADDSDAGAEDTACREIEADVQVRYRSRPSRARVVGLGGGRARVELSRPVEAVAPGQCAVFYRGDEVLGGGWIRPSQR
jgi:tRNA-specific 2-thiouridylase